MKKLILTLSALCFIAVPGFAQEVEKAEEEGEKGTWEISLSPIYSYVPSLSESLLKSEFHVTYWVNAKWGGGVSYTHKFIDGEEINDDIALIGSWNVKNT
ncbi:hypothetical protein [Niabella ginsengisoli]|uniref:Uncharacterized protein n=1 Tax=Niabella ginsengisoli TaxID=522298 RepID=A0ABS9SKI7_9BACT|nr:hypothetical protein [Niabella ginsengisoli]MCH5598899.1 hypothetical protein [Niabella ginsengisoli]